MVQGEFSNKFETFISLIKASLPTLFFQAEAYVDKGAPAKLWDGVTWHRPVMDKTKAFTVHSPGYGIVAGGHVPEIFDATLQDCLTCDSNFAFQIESYAQLL